MSSMEMWELVCDSDFAHELLFETNPRHSFMRNEARKYSLKIPHRTTLNPFVRINEKN